MRIRSVSGWISESRGHLVSFPSEMPASDEPSDERWEEAVIQTSGSIYSDNPSTEICTFFLSCQNAV